MYLARFSYDVLPANRQHRLCNSGGSGRPFLCSRAALHLT